MIKVKKSLMQASPVFRVSMARSMNPLIAICIFFKMPLGSLPATSHTGTQRNLNLNLVWGVDLAFILSKLKRFTQRMLTHLKKEGGGGGELVTYPPRSRRRCASS